MNCVRTGQDAQFRHGEPWPDPRFQARGDVVIDHLTGLIWSRNANPWEFPMTWAEALDAIREMNRTGALGHRDWRLPNRIELRSLVGHQTCRPALPQDHFLENVVESWYWSSTTAAISPSHAWYVNMAGGRMFFGEKRQFFMALPVRGEGNGILPATGQNHCYDADGQIISCAGTGQDGETGLGHSVRDQRFIGSNGEVRDCLTDLIWRQSADLTGDPVSWQAALAAITVLNRKTGGDWRLPNINELESLVDCSRHSPAQSKGHPFTSLHDVYWSSTTSTYEPAWSWALYLDKGAVGVGHKRVARFSVWPVRDWV